jgi:hypothetical protein
MSPLVQDLIVSLVALGAVSTIAVRVRGMFAKKPAGTACGGCAKCPTTYTSLQAIAADTSAEQHPRIIRLTPVGGR